MPDVAAITHATVDPARPQALLRAGALAVNRGAGVAAQVGVQVAVGAIAGAAGIGLLQLHMAWSAVLGELVGAGEPTRALRDTAVCGAAGRAGAVTRALRAAARRIIGYGVLLALVTVLALALGLIDPTDRAGGALLASILLSAPLFALTRLLAETLKALEQTGWAVFLENTLMPLAILAVCAALALGIWPPSALVLLGAAVAGLVLSAALMLLVLTRHLGPDRSAGGPAAAALPITRRGEQLHFWLNGLLNIAFLQLPFLLMPGLLAAEDIGRYAVAHKLINVITTLLILMAAVYGPRFARAAADRDGAALRRLLGETQRISLALFLPAAAALLSLAGPLAALFSLPPGSLLLLLALLAAGQLGNAATGLSGVLLNMSGAAHLEFRLLLLSCLATAAAAVVLASVAGTHGVAAAVAAGIVLRNVASYLIATRHIHTLTNAE